MPTLSALSPVSEAIYAALTVPEILTLVPGGVVSDVPQGAQFPFLWYEVLEEDQRGFGTGRHLAEVEIRIHVFSAAASTREAQHIMSAVHEVLCDTRLTISGFHHWGGLQWLRTTGYRELVNGVKVHEWVSLFRAIVESTP